MAFATSDDVSIHYEAWGEGPALVFAHGAGGNTWSWWQQVPHFAGRHRVIAFDHRGFGRSACTGDQFQPGRFADDLCAVLDAEGVERAAVVCQSMGGWTGLATALRHPARVRCLVLGGTPAGVFTDGVARCFAKMAAELRDVGMIANRALAPDFPARDPERAFLYERISAQNPGLPPEAIARLPAEQVDPRALEGFAVPTLMLAGAEDQLFAPEALREVAAMLPGAELREFPGIGHSLYFEDAPTFNRILEDFLAKHS